MTTDSFTNPQVQKCPFPFIHELHATAPVYRDPVTGFFVLSRFDDIAYVSMHPELFSNKTDVILGGKTTPGADRVRALYESEGGFERFHTLVTNDPPDHARYRAIVDKVFAPSFVKSLEPYLNGVVDESIDAFIEVGHADLLNEYCVRLPMYVISDQLGVPRSDWREIKKWSDSAVALINPELAIEERLALCRIHIELQRYLASVRQRCLTRQEDNFFSRLAHAEINGERLSESQFVNVSEQLLIAGNETTTNAIAHAVVKAIRVPQLMERLQREPSQIGNYVEEILRLHAPSPHLYRTTLQDVELSGIPIKKGEVVMLSYLAGNYDPSHYDHPEEVDLNRKGIKHHLAFGRGIHYCVGNQLARSELRIAVARLFARAKNLRFSPDKPEPQIAAIYHVHAVANLDVDFDPGSKVAAAR